MLLNCFECLPALLYWYLEKNTLSLKKLTYAILASDLILFIVDICHDLKKTHRVPSAANQLKYMYNFDPSRTLKREKKNTQIKTKTESLRFSYAH